MTLLPPLLVAALAVLAPAGDDDAVDAARRRALATDDPLAALTAVLVGEGARFTDEALAAHGDLVQELVLRQLERDDPDAALGLLDAVGRRALGRERLEGLRTHTLRVQQYLAAEQVLLGDPADEAALLTAGLYWAAYMGDVETGCRFLADTEDSALSQAARLERFAPYALDWVPVAAGSWEAWSKDQAAGSEPRALGVARALHWYRHAAEQLEGAGERQFAEHVAELEREPPPTFAGARWSLAPGPSPWTRRPAPPPIPAVANAVQWLLFHRATDGHWGAATFDEECSHCGGKGDPQHDVGITSLALLALMAAYPDGGDEELERVLDEGTRWLAAAQDPATGLIGGGAHSEVYDHALATQALCRAYARGGHDDLAEPALLAVRLVLSVRSTFQGWRYSIPSDETSDTSITAWMALALCAARDAGLDVECYDALEGAAAWFTHVTDPETGRVGYVERGSASSRVPGRNDSYRFHVCEGLTAAALHAVRAMGEDLGPWPFEGRARALVFGREPFLDRDGFAHDLLYWYHSAAFFSLVRDESPGPWRRWRLLLRAGLEPLQSRRAGAFGSWAPIGPWGFAGGRVYSTAMGVLILTRG